MHLVAFIIRIRKCLEGLMSDLRSSAVICQTTRYHTKIYLLLLTVKWILKSELSLNLFLTCEKLRPCFSRSGNLEKAQTIHLAGWCVQHSWDETWQFAEDFFPMCHSLPLIRQMPFPLRLPFVVPTVFFISHHDVVSEERKARQLHFVVQSLHGLDKR